MNNILIDTKKKRKKVGKTSKNGRY